MRFSSPFEALTYFALLSLPRADVCRGLPEDGAVSFLFSHAPRLYNLDGTQRPAPPSQMRFPTMQEFFFRAEFLFYCIAETVDAPCLICQVHHARPLHGSPVKVAQLPTSAIPSPRGSSFMNRDFSC